MTGENFYSRAKSSFSTLIIFSFIAWCVEPSIGWMPYVTVISSFIRYLLLICEPKWKKRNNSDDKKINKH